MAGGLHRADRGCSSGRCGVHRQIRGRAGTTVACQRPRGAYWGHAPDHRDNRRRDRRRIACHHVCGQHRCNAQDVSHHRADRHGRHHHRVARGQAPSVSRASRLARQADQAEPRRTAALRASITEHRRRSVIADALRAKIGSKSAPSSRRPWVDFPGRAEP